MNWILISLLPPMIWSITNHIDKFILNRYFKGTNGGPFMIVTSIACLVFLPLIYFLYHPALLIGANVIATLILIGFFTMFAGILYLYALTRNDPSVVVPLFQVTPVFNYILGSIFLQEHLTKPQLIGSLLIILGAIAITIEFEGKRFRMHSLVFLAMMGACAIHSLYDLFFKSVVTTQSLWSANFWSFLGSALFGFAALLLIPGWRQQLTKIFRHNRASSITLLAFNEGINLTAAMIFHYALLIMPIALVSVVANGLQPIFVLFFGIVLTVFFPHLGKEKLTRGHVIQKITAIAIIFLGTYFLNYQ